MSVSRKVLQSAPAVSREIGFYLSGMEEGREQLHEPFAGMSVEAVGRRAVFGAHSIGALVLHIGESEWFWMQGVLSVPA